MTKIFRFLIFSTVVILLVVAIGIGLLQLPYVRENLRQWIFTAVQKQGMVLTIQSIEGDPPFKWTMRGVHLQISSTESVDIDLMRLRIAILPLLRKEFSISYLHADHATYRFAKQEGKMIHFSSLPWAFSVKSLKIEQLRAIDVSTGEEMTYSLQGRGRLRCKAKAFTLQAKASSSELALDIDMEGSKKGDYISAELSLDVRSARSFAPFYVLPYDTAFLFSTKLAGPWKTWKGLLLPKPDELYLRPLIGTIQGNVQRLNIPQLQGLDQSGSIDADFELFSNHALTLPSFNLKSDLLCLKGKAKLEGNFYPESFSLSFLVPHLSRIAPLGSGIVFGDAKFNGSELSCSLGSDKIEIGKSAFSGIHGKLEASLKQDEWKGSLALSGSHPTAPMEAAARFSCTLGQFFDFGEISLKAPDTIASGSVRFSLREPDAVGSIFLQAYDLSHFAPFALDSSGISGKLGLSLNFKGPDLFFQGTAQNFHFFDLLSAEMSIDGFATDFFHAPKGKLSLDGKTTYLGQFFFDSLFFDTWWEKEAWPYRLEGRGKWKDYLSISSQGSWAFTNDAFDWQVKSLQGQILQKHFALQKPFSLHSTPDSKVLTECYFTFANGYLLSAFSLSPTGAKIHMKGEHFPVDLFALSTSRFTLAGNASLDVSLEGKDDTFKGRANLLLEGADILQAGKKDPIRSKGSLQINIDNGVAQVHTSFAASGQQFCDLAASLPISYHSYPLKISIDKTKPLSADLTMEGHLEEIFDFINIGSHRTTGLLSAHLLLSNTLSSPLLQGMFSWQEGSYENYFTGMVLKDVHAEGSAEGKEIRLHTIYATDGAEGKMTASGSVDLKEKLPFSFDASLQALKILQLDWLGTSCTGPIKITGDMNSALAEGSLTISRADISIPNDLPMDLPILPVTFINEPAYLKQKISSPEPPYPFHYDAFLHAPSNIFLTGRGLNCELEGKLHIFGKNLALDASGSLKLLKGKFSFAGKEFTLTQGELTFSDNPNSPAYLNISGTLVLSDLTVTATLRGPLEAPLLSFQSSPSLPTSSILARMLFNKDVSELTALQALQLADTIVTLSGGAGPNVLETIRESLGIDRLNITSGETDRLAVQIGKYLMQGVMITLSQSTESSQVIVEVELKHGFSLQAETQEDDQAKFSIKWNMNY